MCSVREYPVAARPVSTNGLALTSPACACSHLDAALYEFDRALQMVTSEDLDCDTSIPGVTVRALVNHVVMGNSLAVFLLDGACRDAAQNAVCKDLLGSDHYAAWRESATAQSASFRRSGADTAKCEHPHADLAGSELREYRTVDLVLHTSDLWAARGTQWRCPIGLFGVLVSSRALMRRLVEPSALSRLDNLVGLGPNPGG